MNNYNLYFEKLKIYSAFAQKHTIQFLKDDLKKKISAHGSGLLVKVFGRHFLITAAHVMRDEYKDIYVIFDGKKLVLGGDLKMTTPPNPGDPDSDKLDIALMEINQGIVTQIEASFSFLDISDIKKEQKHIDSPKYMIVGYPATKTSKVWNHEMIKSKSFINVSKPHFTFDYSKFGFNENKHLAIEFDRNIVSERSVHSYLAPKLEGISGSGLWYVQDMHSDRLQGNVILAGIVTERVNEPNQKAVICTKISLVLQLLESGFNIGK